MVLELLVQTAMIVLVMARQGRQFLDAVPVTTGFLPYSTILLTLCDAQSFVASVAF